MSVPRATLVACVVGLLLSGKANAVHGTCDATTYPPPDRDRAAGVVFLTNQHRVGMGLQPLSVSGTLERTAEWKARNMAATGFFSHSDSDGRSFGTRVRDCGYPSSAGAGENIAVGYQTAQSVFAGWLSSPGHRANIESRNWVAIGAGASFGQGSWWWAQNFGTVFDGHPRLSLRRFKSRLCRRHYRKGGARGRIRSCRVSSR